MKNIVWFLISVIFVNGCSYGYYYRGEDKAAVIDLETCRTSRIYKNRSGKVYQYNTRRTLKTHYKTVRICETKDKDEYRTKVWVDMNNSGCEFVRLTNDPVSKEVYHCPGVEQEVIVDPKYNDKYNQKVILWSIVGGVIAITSVLFIVGIATGKFDSIADVRQ